VDNEFWWPDQACWPARAGKKVTRKSFVAAFATKGYAVCDGPEPEPGYEKIALYEKAGVPTHAARQLPDGRWTSKLGSAHDIAHSLDALTGTVYGAPAMFLRRAV
jgi:hypothetical protein